MWATFLICHNHRPTYLYYIGELKNLWMELIVEYYRIAYTMIPHANAHVACESDSY